MAVITAICAATVFSALADIAAETIWPALAACEAPRPGTGPDTEQVRAASWATLNTAALVTVPPVAPPAMTTRPTTKATATPAATSATPFMPPPPAGLGGPPGARRR
jgi:hypothetical protein